KASGAKKAAKKTAAKKGGAKKAGKKAAKKGPAKSARKPAGKPAKGEEESKKRASSAVATPRRPQAAPRTATSPAADRDRSVAGKGPRGGAPTGPTLKQTPAARAKMMEKGKPAAVKTTTNLGKHVPGKGETPIKAPPGL